MPTVGRYLAYLLNRANHTGTQDASTITGLPGGGGSTPNLTFNFSSFPDTLEVDAVCVLYIPEALTITKVVLHGQGASGSTTVDLLIANTAADIAAPSSITGGSPVVLSADYSVEVTTFTGWTTSLGAGKYLIAKITSSDMAQASLSVITG